MAMMGGRAETRARRQEQATAVRDIVNDWWSAADFSGNFVVVGDLNDYPGAGTALGSLLNHPHLVNVVNRLPVNQRWTHYWAGGDEYHQLDYILLSRALADHNPGRPGIERLTMIVEVKPEKGEVIRIDRVNLECRRNEISLFNGAFGNQVSEVYGHNARFIGGLKPALLIRFPQIMESLRKNTRIPRRLHNQHLLGPFSSVTPEGLPCFISASQGPL